MDGNGSHTANLNNTSEFPLKKKGKNRPQSASVTRNGGNSTAALMRKNIL